MGADQEGGNPSSSATWDRKPESSETGVRKILVAVDRSSLAIEVLTHAVPLALALRAELSLVQVLSATEHDLQGQPVDAVAWQLRRTETDAYLEGLCQQLREIGLRANHRVLDGFPAEQILHIAREEHVDLIAVGNSDPSEHFEFGLSTTAEQIVARAGCSVLIVPPGVSAGDELAGLRYRLILAPMDGSSRAERVLPLCARLTEFHGAQLMLAHVVAEPQLTPSSPPTHKDLQLVRDLVARNARIGRIYMDRLLSQLGNRGIQVNSVVEQSKDARKSLVDVAEREQVDLVVASADGCTGTRTLGYGSVTRHLIGGLRWPLIVVRSSARWESLAQDQDEQLPEERGGRPAFFRESGL